MTAPAPPPGEPFGGVIGRTIGESRPWWPPARHHAGAPDVVLIVLDDTGFAHLGCYGSTIATPAIDAIAAAGVRFTGFHTTAMCSSSRAALLTGRNHHAVGMRAISSFDTGFPNTRGLPRSAATVAEVLREAGYATFAAGKWHLAPMQECSAAGPFHSWPLGKGFDRYYGFLPGMTDQFRPELTCDNHFVPPPALPEDGYHLSEDIVDHAVGFVRDHVSLTPERPLFLYVAFGATHAPHQAPKPWLDRYRGAFDKGWDDVRAEWFARQKALGVVPADTELTPRNPGVRPSAELSGNEQRFAARLQEAFAASLGHADAQIGRLMAFLDQTGRLDNTLVVVLSDNGACPGGTASGVFDQMRQLNGLREDVDAAVARLDEIGGPTSFTNIPWGWAQAGNAPLKWYKTQTHGGGVRDPLVIRWPRGLAGDATPGGLRHGFCHVIDIAPTILEVAGVAAPASVGGVAQMPVHGTSLVPALADGASVARRGPQYFEMLGHRAIWANGWKAVCLHYPGTPFENDSWELYDLERDFSESRDLAQQEPERLQRLIALWWAEAERHGVLPLDDRFGVALLGPPRPDAPGLRDRVVYHPPISHIVSDACPPEARGWRTSIDLDHDGGDGALFARGSGLSGFALYVRGGRLAFDYVALGARSVTAAADQLGKGRRHVRLDVSRTEAGGAEVALMVDGVTVATGAVSQLLGVVSTSGMDVGCALFAVDPDCTPPFAYTGRIERMTFETPAAMTDAEAEARFLTEMERQ